MIVKLLYFINEYIYKSKNKIVLISNSFSFGNMKIFYEEISKITDKKIVLISKKIEYKKNNFLLKSIKGIYHLLTSKYIFTSHHVPAILNKKNQDIISFHHGIPFLYNSKMDTNVSIGLDNLKYQTSFSKNIDKLYIKAFNKKIDFIYTGDPIFDFYNNPIKYLNNFEKKYIKYIGNIRKEKIIYIPKNYNKKYVPRNQQTISINFLIKDIIYLAKNIPDKFFILSLHPNEEEISQQNLLKISKIKNIEINKISSEKLVPFIDYVITDCSSMLFQAIYLEKKIFIYFPDLEKFEKNNFLTTTFLTILNKKLIFRNKEDLLLNFKNNNYDIDYILQSKNKLFPDKYIDISLNIYKKIIGEKK